MILWQHQSAFGCVVKEIAISKKGIQQTHFKKAQTKRRGRGRRLQTPQEMTCKQQIIMLREIEFPQAFWQFVFGFHFIIFKENFAATTTKTKAKRLLRYCICLNKYYLIKASSSKEENNNIDVDDRTNNTISKFCAIVHLQFKTLDCVVSLQEEKEKEETTQKVQKRELLALNKSLTL